MSSSDFEEFDAQIIETHARAPETSNINLSSGEKGIPFPVPAPEPKHQRFYFEGGEATFLVQGTLYRIPHYFLLRDSPYFQKLLNDSAKSVGSASPIPLDNVDCAEFDAILSILYPTDFHECELKTAEAWTAVLRLSTEWSFASVRKLAISRLQPFASAVDKVVLGHKYGVEAWIRPGRVALCNRPEPLTWEEGLRLGFGDIMLITTVRERLRMRPKSDPQASEIEVMIEDYFKKEGKVGSAKKVDDEVVAGKRAYEEAVQRKKAFEEAAARRVVEEAAAKKRADDEAAAKKNERDEAAAKKRADDEAEAKRQAEENSLKMAEEEARQKDEKEAAFKKWEEEYDRRVAEEAAAKKAQAAEKRKVDETASRAASKPLDKSAHGLFGRSLRPAQTPIRVANGPQKIF
ncbi:hypothetical protein EVG20_g6399 [Dentipellis fragilis]|uniref:BTB domain-containing protein n=1 Tax=Dentipellis fragilis TaxID=205917 RepID=A0A4Y9YQC0_9AGAM|nr:hypothetical protein EVG20_g6399 [Dentipellis fragilis]